ncbi:MAG: TPM domain-containing protein, partial [Gemmatimonadetes bacterium]|nr:TPM domain-containing protein [Gemmatimonadota bacterium]
MRARVTNPRPSVRLGVGLPIAALAFVTLQDPQIPAPRGYVNDFADVVPAASEARLERIAEDVRLKSGGEIVVVTLRDLGDRDQADVAREIGRSWKVGRQGRPGDAARNTGVIVLIVPKETSSDGRGRFRIETGYGAEAFLPDAVTGRVQDEALPLLKVGEYGGALELTVTRVAQRFAGEFGFALDTTLVAPRVVPPTVVPPGALPGGPAGGIPFVWLLFLFFFVFILLRSLSRRGSRRSGCGGCLPIFLPMPGGGSGGGWRGG